MIQDRLGMLREELRREHLSAFIFPKSDPHHSEYTADHWKGREWISGFNGSAGTAVVTLKSAALWTDSRYFIAAAKQLLIETRLPVSEIAYQLGFEYPQHFSRLFKSRTGMTPNEYRLTA